MEATGDADVLIAKWKKGLRKLVETSSAMKKLLESHERTNGTGREQMGTTDRTKPVFEDADKGETNLGRLRRRRNLLLRKRKEVSQKLELGTSDDLSLRMSSWARISEGPALLGLEHDIVIVNRQPIIAPQDAGEHQCLLERRRPRQKAPGSHRQRKVDNLEHAKIPGTGVNANIMHADIHSTKLHAVVKGDNSGQLPDMDRGVSFLGDFVPSVVRESAGPSTTPGANDGLQMLQKEALEGPWASLSGDPKADLTPSGPVEVDASLTININAPVPELQTQIYQVCQRLKNSYPKIDALPYDMWTSSNRTTLQTWLRILAGKWQTRFNDVPRLGQKNGTEMNPIDRGVKEILDHMVRCHDLDREAAKRMAGRWQEVFERKCAPRRSRQAGEENLDWDEIDAGLAWLKEEQHQDSIVDSAQFRLSSNGPMQRENALPAPRVQRSPSYGFASAFTRHYSTATKKPSGEDRGLISESTGSAPGDTPETAGHTITTTALPHLTPGGAAHMVSVSEKPHTIRTAIAVGTVRFSNPLSVELIRSNSAKKGDVLSVSRVAGIMAAKRCPDLIPLCHPIMLTSVGVELGVLDSSDGDFGRVIIKARVQCEGQTGVEMEALTAVMGSALSVVDMCKAVDRGIRIDGVRVVLKEGGRSGIWKE